MMRFLGGPAGKVADGLLLKRCPHYLRVTVSQTGEWDALDQLGDEPGATEKVYVYRRQGSVARIHCRFSKRTISGWYESAEYWYLDRQPEDAVVRNKERWQQWCIEQVTGAPR